MLFKEFGLLERDQHTPQEASRYRRYGNAIILPWENDNLSWLPMKNDKNGWRQSEYDQGNNNPEHNNIRYFPALSSEIKNSEFLKDLILDDFRKTHGICHSYLSIYVGIHFVTINCIDKDSPGFIANLIQVGYWGY